ncbi:MAG: hypothetical protein ACOC32_02510 [Nanoarchaeota archaeon]
MMFVLFLVSASSVFGAPEITSISTGLSSPPVLVALSGSTVTFGTDDSTEYARGEEISTELTFKANETINSTVTLTLIDTSTRYDLDDFSFTAEHNGNNITSNGQTLNLTFDSNDEAAVTITATLPLDLNSGSGEIAELKVLGYDVDVKYEAESRLRIEDLEVDVPEDNVDIIKDGEDEDSSSEEVYPLEDVDISIRVKNLFDDNNDDYDFEIEDIEVEVIVEDFDDEGYDDLELDEDVKDLDAEDDDNVDFSFEVPFFVEDRDYEIRVIVTGDDENGAQHLIEKTFDLDVRLENTVVYVESAYLSRTRLSCGERTTLNTRFINIGEDDLEEVALIVQNDKLDIFEEVRGIDDLEPYSEDDDDSILKRSFTIDVPEDADEDTYEIDLEFFYSGDALLASRRLELVVEDCDADEEDDAQDDEQDGSDSIIVDDQQLGQDQEPIDITPVITDSEDEEEPVEGSLLSEDLYLVMLAGLNAILLVGVIALIVVVARKPRH